MSLLRRSRFNIQYTLCARLRPPRAATLSTTAALRNAPTDPPPNTEGLDKLAKVLTNLGERMPAAPPHETNRRTQQYIPFTANSFIRPYDLSLEGRTHREKPYSRASGVGLSAIEARSKDVFHQLGIDPLKYASHPAVISPFLTEMGKIIPRRLTELSAKSQRRIGKAIRRAKMMGIIPLHGRIARKGQYW
ncbi:hypothetical protein C8F04DRAFT_1249784 [Mycena alexandri]|uniref:Small ribosomal subunit protein bS18m n=1 Tax=Mycena alexandri TaxID=1745969 RepID=A0AAD6XGK1_9AGAR|nr:hypothetical protein C8F04DRAFT_1249784 [Mycena alexandri]